MHIKINIKEFLIFTMIFFSFSSPVFSAAGVSSQIQELEKAYFGYDYPDDTDKARLNRLELAIYGRTYQESMTERINNLYADINTQTQQEQEELARYEENSEERPLPKAESDVKYPVVDKMEQKILKKTYENEDIYNRLARLEKQVFKKESTGSLNERVDALRGKVLYESQPEIDLAMDDDISSSELLDDSKYNYYSYEGSKNRIAKPSAGSIDTFDIDSLEESVFSRKTYGSINERLSKLEQKVFQRTFSDSTEARTQRLLAVTTAQKTAKQYDNNKWMNRLNTGMQIGGVILMILAMIL